MKKLLIATLLLLLAYNKVGDYLWKQKALVYMDSLDLGRLCSVNAEYTIIEHGKKRKIKSTIEWSKKFHSYGSSGYCHEYLTAQWEYQELNDTYHKYFGNEKWESIANIYDDRIFFKKIDEANK